MNYTKHFMERTNRINIIDRRTGETKIMGLPESVTNMIKDLVKGKEHTLHKRKITVKQIDGEYSVKLDRLPRKLKKKMNRFKINYHGNRN